jgi:hypothetical protein
MLQADINFRQTQANMIVELQAENAALVERIGNIDDNARGVGQRLTQSKLRNGELKKENDALKESNQFLNDRISELELSTLRAVDQKAAIVEAGRTAMELDDLVQEQREKLMLDPNNQELGREWSRNVTELFKANAALKALLPPTTPEDS